MKVVEEIGLKKAFEFVFFSILQVIYHLAIDHLFFIPPARSLLLALLGAKIGKNTILMDVKFFNWHQTGLAGLEIGHQCFIGDGTLIDLYDRVILGDQVTIAQRVTILTHLNVGYQNHPLQKYFPKMSKPVIFKSGSVVAAAATILPGITIGKNSFVAAGSVVNRNVPDNTLVAGVPAKIIRKIK